jgi:hypothetical protein
LPTFITSVQRMSDGNIFLDLKADPSGMVRALEVVYEKVDKLSKSFERQKEKVEDVDKATAKMAKDADKLISSLLTDTEKYEQELAKLQVMRAKDLLTEEQYARAVSKAKQELWQKNEALKKAEIVTAEIVRESRSWQAAVGDDLFGSITKAGVALMVVQNAQQKINELVEKEQELRRQGGTERERISERLGALQQYTNANEIEGAARGFLKSGRFSVDQAFDIAESLQANSMIGEASSLQNIGSSYLLGKQGFVDYVKSAGAFKQAFKSKAPSSERLLSMALGAAEKAPGQASEVLNWASQAAGNLQMAGFNPEQALALTDITSRVHGEKSIAALTEFGKAVAKDPDLAGKTPEQIVSAVKSRNPNQADLFKMFPDTAIKVWNELSGNVGEYTRSEATVRGYGDTGFGMQRVGAAYGRNAGIQGSQESIGAEQDTRIFRQGEQYFNRTRIRERIDQAVGSALIDIREGAWATGGALPINTSPLSDSSTSLLNIIATATQATASLLQKSEKSAPQSQPQKEQ